MGIEQDIESIRAGIGAGRFSNEASVSQGIVLRLLHALGWPSFDPEVVWPEYSLNGTRVDYALCQPARKPFAFIEVKQIGQSDGAEQQLFQYAFHAGVPLAILTDGREWNFFLPAEQGNYGERRVYKLDLVERDIKESARRLERYLLHSDVVSGIAIQCAREDYKSVSKDRQMLAALPTAWSQIIAEEDEMLLEIVADRVESLSGFKPDPDMVADFLKKSGAGRFVVPAQIPITPQTTKSLVTALTSIEQPEREATWASAQDPVVSQRNSSRSFEKIGFTFEGTFHPARNAIDTLKQVFDLLIQRDPQFGERFAGLPRHGSSRRYFARDATELYPGRADLSRECSIQLTSGWWMGTNYSKQSIARIITMACEVAHLSNSRDLVAHLGN